MKNDEKKLGQHAVALGLITVAQLRECLEIQKALIDEQNKEIGLVEIMIEKGFIRRNQVEALSRLASDSSPSSSSASQNSSGNFEGSQFGRYEIIEQIGIGGMGQVYRARDPQLDRVVAIKMLLSDRDKDVQRFLREARLMANLKHPNIVGIFDIGSEGSKHFFAMDFVEGITLQKYIYQSSRVDIAKAIDISISLVRALEYAHTNEVVHRDLKPANIILEKGSNPVILDFGLAKISGVQSELSQDGSVLGTLYYMSPEQIEGKIDQVDAVSDLYSLGAVIYEMLTQNSPFRAKSLPEIVRKVTAETPTLPSELNPSVPKKIEDIVMKLLAKEKWERYASASELLEALTGSERSTLRVNDVASKKRQEVNQHVLSDSIFSDDLKIGDLLPDESSPKPSNIASKKKQPKLQPKKAALAFKDDSAEISLQAALEAEEQVQMTPNQTVVLSKSPTGMTPVHQNHGDKPPTGTVVMKESPLVRRASSNQVEQSAPDWKLIGMYGGGALFALLLVYVFFLRPTSLSTMWDAFQSEDMEQQLQYLSTIEKHYQKEEDAIPVLVQALNSRFLKTRTTSFRLIKDFGSLAEDSLREALEYSEDYNDKALIQVVKLVKELSLKSLKKEVNKIAISSRTDPDLKNSAIDAIVSLDPQQQKYYVFFQGSWKSISDMEREGFLQVEDQWRKPKEYIEELRLKMQKLRESRSSLRDKEYFQEELGSLTAPLEVISLLQPWNSYIESQRQIHEKFAKLERIRGYESAKKLEQSILYNVIEVLNTPLAAISRMEKKDSSYAIVLDQEIKNLVQSVKLWPWGSEKNRGYLDKFEARVNKIYQKKFGN